MKKKPEVNENVSSELAVVSEPATTKVKKDKKSLIVKISKIFLDVFVVLFASFAIFSLVIAVSSKTNPDNTTIFGKRVFFVQSDSMGECADVDVSQYEIKSIPVKSCIFVETVPEDETKKEEWYSAIEVGDVLTFKYHLVSSQDTITHRVINIESKESGGYIFTLEGDNHSSSSNVGQQIIDTSLDNSSTNYIIGKVTGQNYALGLIIYALKSTVGICCIVILPCAIIIVYNLYRIINVLRLDKKEKLQLETNQKNEEIELLKQQIAELQKDDSNKKDNIEEEN